MEYINIQPGERVSYKEGNWVIKRIIDLQNVVLEDSDTGGMIKAKINDLKSAQVNALANDQRDLMLINDEEWLIAQKRFSIIQPILVDKRNGDLVKEICLQNNLNKSTLYRWISKYEQTGLLSSLVPQQKSGGRGKSRINPNVEAIIQECINKHYLSKQNKTVAKLCIEVALRCRQENLEVPHSHTVRNRVLSITERDKVKYRGGQKMYKEKYRPLIGSYPDAHFPLATIQIDHTIVDLVLVDDEYRVPIGRPHITLAIDVYSRMIVGYYISFDPPSTTSVGICLSTAILPKEELLVKLDVPGEWPCWGFMRTIHADNGKDFRGNMLKMACEEYGIEMTWRPVLEPRYGGHIERLMGTFGNEVHQLPGTTFSSIADKGDYNSNKMSAFTLREFEKWFVDFVVNVYHKRLHGGINTSPYQKFIIGILGDGKQLGTGIPSRIQNKEKVFLDFLPFVLRTVQEYGVSIDNIYYYHDVLQRWIHANEYEKGKKLKKRQFIFKRDPRDISLVYFYDPELKEYFPIPYRNVSRPAISAWEFKKAIQKLKDEGKSHIDEDAIFEAYERLSLMENSAVEKTLKSKRMLNKKLAKNLTSRSINGEKPQSESTSNIYVESVALTNENDIEPFDEIEYGSFE